MAEVKLLVFAALMLADESREARGMAKQAETARASATDNAETLATALEELITSRVDKMSKKVGGRRLSVVAAAASRDAYIGCGADFCAVRGSLKTPGPIRTPGSCSWP